MFVVVSYDHSPFKGNEMVLCFNGKNTTAVLPVISSEYTISLLFYKQCANTEWTTETIHTLKQPNKPNHHESYIE